GVGLAAPRRGDAGGRRPGRGRAGLILGRRGPPGPGGGGGAPARLGQVVGNLLSNAAKFTDPGGKVSVRLAADPARRQAVLTVRDTGVGIDPAFLPRIFESFMQADRTVGRSRGGLGLGLALVKGLVELHGGEVRAASGGPGTGADGTVTLPLLSGTAA